MLNINISIQADADSAFTAKEQDILNALAGVATKTTQVGEVKVTEPAKAEPAPVATEEAAPAKPKRTRRTKAQIEADKAAEEAAEAAHGEDEEEPKTLQEELAEDDNEEPSAADLRKEVVALASKLVSDGQAAGVRKVLTDLGAKKVSELKDKDLPALKTALEDLDIN